MAEAGDTTTAQTKEEAEAKAKSPGKEGEDDTDGGEKKDPQQAEADAETKEEAEAKAIAPGKEGEDDTDGEEKKGPQEAKANAESDGTPAEKDEMATIKEKASEGGAPPENEGGGDIASGAPEGTSPGGKENSSLTKEQDENSKKERKKGDPSEELWEELEKMLQEMYNRALTAEEGYEDRRGLSLAFTAVAGMVRRVSKVLNHVKAREYAQTKQVMDAAQQGINQAAFSASDGDPEMQLLSENRDLLPALRDVMARMEISSLDTAERREAEEAMRRRKEEEQEADREEEERRKLLELAKSGAAVIEELEIIEPDDAIVFYEEEQEERKRIIPGRKPLVAVKESCSARQAPRAPGTWSHLPRVIYDPLHGTLVQDYMSGSIHPSILSRSRGHRKRSRRVRGCEGQHRERLLASLHRQLEKKEELQLRQGSQGGSSISSGAIYAPYERLVEPFHVDEAVLGALKANAASDPGNSWHAYALGMALEAGGSYGDAAVQFGVARKLCTAKPDPGFMLHEWWNLNQERLAQRPPIPPPPPDLLLECCALCSRACEGPDKGAAQDIQLICFQSHLMLAAAAINCGDVQVAAAACQHVVRAHDGQDQEAASTLLQIAGAAEKARLLQQQG